MCIIYNIFNDTYLCVGMYTLSAEAFRGQKMVSYNLKLVLYAAINCPI